LTKAKIKEYREIICDEISCYIGSNHNQKYSTATERQRELKQLVVACQNLVIGVELQNIKKADNWKPKVSKRLFNLSLENKKVIYQYYDNAEKDQPHLKASLDNYIINGLDDHAIYLLKAISKIDLKDSEKMSKVYLRDPPLQRLIMNLAPVWVDTTGRSLVHVSIDREYDHIRKNYFADWLCHLISGEGATPPNKQAISDIAKKL
jgi:hypothetical protein